MSPLPSIRERVVFRGLGKSSLGHVSARGHLRTSHGLIKFRTLKSYALVYVLSGDGFYEDLHLGLRAIRAGDVIVVFPGIPHRYGPTAPEGWSEIYLLFEGLIFDTWRHQGVLSLDLPVLHAEPIGEWSRRFSEILQGSGSSASSVTCLRAVCQVQTLVADLLAWRASCPRFDDDAAWLDRAVALLESPPHCGLAAIARQMGSSLESFRKRFRRLACISASTYRTTHLMDRACVLIQEGRLRDAQIADLLGFYDPAHFSKRFKRVVGVPPSAFRAQLPDVRSP
jgi:AraC-like DNA-binding protein